MGHLVLPRQTSGRGLKATRCLSTKVSVSFLPSHAHHHLFLRICGAFSRHTGYIQVRPRSLLGIFRVLSSPRIIHSNGPQMHLCRRICFPKPWPIHLVLPKPNTHWSRLVSLQPRKPGTAENGSQGQTFHEPKIFH